ncbi:MAG: nitroreductase family protein [Flavobacteriales bacterium]|nr:nitroreductase family protein [Flavobacteriales bacterium]
MSLGDTRRSELDINPVLNGRYSPRAFSDRAVTDAELELVLEAARWAPSSMNEQPWRFLVTRRGGDGHAALLATLNHSNQVWADKAPVLILAMAHRTLSRIGQENFHARHDLGIATAQLTAQATALGMGVHILGGFNALLARETFAIPEDFDIVSVLVLGFPGDADQLTDNLKERELRRSPRRSLNELVHYGSFRG